jgi:hypothetical protein
LTGVGEPSNSKANEADSSAEHVWFMESRNDDINYKAMFSKSSTDVLCPQYAAESNVN